MMIWSEDDLDGDLYDLDDNLDLVDLKVDDLDNDLDVESSSKGHRYRPKEYVYSNLEDLMETVKDGRTIENITAYAKTCMI